MFDDVLAVTTLVVTVNVTLLAPAGMVADAGTCATAVRLLLRETTAPPSGAAPFSVSVAVEDVPPVTVVGFTVREIKEARFTVRIVDLVVPP